MGTRWQGAAIAGSHSMRSIESTACCAWNAYVGLKSSDERYPQNQRLAGWDYRAAHENGTIPMTYRYRTLLVHLNDKRRAGAVLEPVILPTLFSH
jgi:hypothetical protein